MGSSHQFEISKHFGSIVIVAITVLVCLLCLIFQLCKKFTRLDVDDTETIQTPVDPPTLPSNADITNQQFLNNQNTIGWNSFVTNPKEQYTTSYCPIGFNPQVMDSKTTTPTEEIFLKANSSRSSGLKTPTGDKVRSSPSYANRQERIHPGFKDHIIYGGDKRNIGWSDDRKY